MKRATAGPKLQACLLMWSVVYSCTQFQQRKKAWYYHCSQSYSSLWDSFWTFISTTNWWKGRWLSIQWVSLEIRSKAQVSSSEKCLHILWKWTANKTGLWQVKIIMVDLLPQRKWRILKLFLRVLVVICVITLPGLTSTAHSESAPAFEERFGATIQNGNACIPKVLHNIGTSTCGIWFYLSTLVLAVVSSALLGLVIRWYKARERGDSSQTLVEDI